MSRDEGGRDLKVENANSKMKAAYAGFDIFFRKSGCKPNRTLLYSLFSPLTKRPSLLEGGY